jgi:predicted small secreted protein
MNLHLQMQLTHLINDITRQSTNAIKILRERFKDEITDDVKSLERFSDVAKFEDFINDARTSYIANVTLCLLRNGTE